MIRMVPLLALAALAACQQQAQPNANNSVPANEATPTPQTTNSVMENTAKPEAAATAAPKTSLPEPKGPIDPKSAEGAGQVVQHYGALIEQGRWTEANALWGSATNATAFAKQLQSGGLKHVEIGDLGEPEGAAGSIYITMPVSFYGDKNRRKAEIVLRRVNDVPGSTEAQRRWHIERIDWKDA